MQLVEEDLKKRKLKVFIFLSIFPLITIMFLFYRPEYQKPYSFFSIIYTLIFLLWVIANIYSNFAIPPYKIIGKIKFKKDKIVLLGMEIPIENIVLLKFIYISYGGRSTSFNSFSITYGNKNILIIKKDDGTNYSNKLLLESPNDYVYIKKVFHAYAKKDLKIEFYKQNKLIFSS